MVFFSENMWRTPRGRRKARAAADAAGGSGVVVYVGKDEMGGKVDASDG